MNAVLLSDIILLITATVVGYWSGLGDRTSVVRFISGGAYERNAVRGSRGIRRSIAEVMAEWQIFGLAMAAVRKEEPPLLR